MRTILEKYLAPIIGIAVILVFFSLGEMRVLELGSTALEGRLIAIFFGIASAQVIDIVTRKKQTSEMLEEVLKRNIADECKLTVFRSGDDAYIYLANNLPKASKIYNTIISSGSYDEMGLIGPSRKASLFQDTKCRIIKEGKIAWEDIVSSGNQAYIDWILDDIAQPGKSKYSAFLTRANIDLFQNFIILEYATGYLEVIVGWIMLYRTAADTSECFLIANQILAGNYKKYFQIIRDNRTRPFLKEDLP
jgi:hypothetical protein